MPTWPSTWALWTVVAELTKTNRDRTLEELLDDHDLQATAYQRANVRLGLLVVLDLMDCGGTGKHFSASSRLLEKAPPGTTTPYSVAEFRIQGRKTAPSLIKKRPRREKPGSSGTEVLASAQRHGRV